MRNEKKGTYAARFEGPGVVVRPSDVFASGNKKLERQLATMGKLRDKGAFRKNRPDA